jgi:hypothetical protein
VEALRVDALERDARRLERQRREGRGHRHRPAIDAGAADAGVEHQLSRSPAAPAATV